MLTLIKHRLRMKTWLVGSSNKCSYQCAAFKTNALIDWVHMLYKKLIYAFEYVTIIGVKNNHNNILIIIIIMIRMWWSCKTLFWFVLFLQKYSKMRFNFYSITGKSSLLLTVILCLLFLYGIKYIFWDFILLYYLVCFSIIESGWFTQIQKPV